MNKEIKTARLVKELDSLRKQEIDTLARLHGLRGAIIVIEGVINNPEVDGEPDKQHEAIEA